MIIGFIPANIDTPFKRYFNISSNNSMTVLLPIKIPADIGPIERFLKGFLEIGYFSGRIYIPPESRVIVPVCGNRVEEWKNDNR